MRLHIILQNVNEFSSLSGSPISPPGAVLPESEKLLRSEHLDLARLDKLGTQSTHIRFLQRGLSSCFLPSNAPTMLQVGEEEGVPVPDNRFDIHKALMAAIPFPDSFCV